MKKGGLGRGLSALIPESGVVSDSDRIPDSPEVNYSEANPGDEAISVSRELVADGVAGDARLEVVGISDIEPNRYQPRRVFDDEKMAEARKLFLEEQRKKGIKGAPKGEDVDPEEELWIPLDEAEEAIAQAGPLAAAGLLAAAAL